MTNEECTKGSAGTAPAYRRGRVDFSLPERGTRGIAPPPTDTLLICLVSAAAIGASRSLEAPVWGVCPIAISVMQADDRLAFWASIIITHFKCAIQ